MIGIMNAALISAGWEDIIQDGDDSVEWRLLSRNWPTIVEGELEDGNYHFTRREDFLATRIDGKFGKEDGFLIPGDVLHVRRCWYVGEDNRRYEPDWTSDAAAVYLDRPEGIYAESIICADPDLWSANFVRGVQHRLEAVILRSLKEEPREAMNMEALAEEHFSRGRARSSQQRSAQPVYKRGPIASARFGRGRE